MVRITKEAKLDSLADSARFKSNGCSGQSIMDHARQGSQRLAQRRPAIILEVEVGCYKNSN